MEIAGIHLGIYDLIALGVMIVFLVLGLVKGFTYQIVRLLTFIVALWLAKRYAGSASDTGQVEAGSFAYQLIKWFPNQFENSPTIAVYVAYFVIFMAMFIVGMMVAYLMRTLLKRFELRSFDRVLGGLMGFVVGGICVIVIVSLIVSILPDSKVTEKLSQSYTMKLSTMVIHQAKPFFPPELVEKIEKAFDDLPPPEPERKPEAQEESKPEK